MNMTLEEILPVNYDELEDGLTATVRQGEFTVEMMKVKESGCSDLYFITIATRSGAIIHHMIEDDRDAAYECFGVACQDHNHF